MKASIDTNVLIDLALGMNRRRQETLAFPWAAAAVERALEFGPIHVSPIVFAEIAGRFASGDAVEAWLTALGFYSDNTLSREALHAAALAHQAYRQAGGARERTLPDFLIGADAQSRGLALITRDAQRYRTCFPVLVLICP